MTEWVPTYTSAQVRAAERPELAKGTPLMLWAARALAQIVADELVDPGVTGRDAEQQFPGELGAPLMGRLLVLAGKGDNGGDALYAAAALLQWMPLRAATAEAPADALGVDVLCTSGTAHEQALATALAAGARRVELGEVSARAGEYDLVLDGVLGIGTGADPALRGSAREAVEVLLPHVRAGRPRVIAVDLPSGLQPDDGTTGDDVVLPASVTVTFGGLKTGLVTGRGPELCGAIVLVEFDLPFASPPVGSGPVAYAMLGRP
ncbi:yjeF N-terminal region [Microbacterium sp. cf046]|uniref:NAD(P)H-hydrate epimerase n=1 Tax=Microbacterium sp. cf046 TaxID=1761803 RepID=UPI0008F24E37|nr:NAD(P)H-hydrate epimerase [Microbacterium sp. cf046]SFS02714.1 yjeF N-terminal region [Microbacterium sp. cf046]